MSRTPQRPVFYPHPDDFLDRAQDWLVREEARYNRFLGLARAARTAAIHNRVSNRIYHALGYRLVAETHDFERVQSY